MGILLRFMVIGAIALAIMAWNGELWVSELDAPPCPDALAIPAGLEPPYMCVDPGTDSMYCFETGRRVVNSDGSVSALYRGFSADVELCEVKTR